MKKILAKIAGIITIFAMTFSPVLATNNNNQQVTFCHVPPGNDGNPQTLTTSYNAWQNGHSNHELDYMGPCEGDDDGDDEEDNTCEETSYVSDGGIDELQVDGHDAVDIAVIHDAWDASIPGAAWVWSESAVVDATATTTKTFTLSFDIGGTPIDANLWVAADNTYKVSVNDSANLFVDANEDNFTAADSYVIPAAELNSGANTIVFEVTNIAVADSTWEGNPAGLMYKLTVNCTDEDDEDDEGDCDTEEGDCDEEENNDNPGSCDEMWAKVDVTDFYNLGDGDVTSDSYVGSDSNVVADGEWFQLHNGTNYIIDPVIDGYEDVPGLAIQRMNGKVRVLLHGSDQPAPNYKEYIKGSVQFYNALVTGVMSDNSGNNMLEDGSGNSTLDSISYSGDTASFELQVDTADDAFYASYAFDGDDDCQPDVCESVNNLVVNGGFEAPDVTVGNWSIFNDGTVGLGWDVQWNGAFVGAPATAKLEIHDNLWTPVVEGAQYAELDADWGYNNGEQASVVISQDIPTVAGHSYTLGYDFSPRPGTGSADNMLAVWVNGSNVQNQVADGSANSGNAWTHYTYNFVATGAMTTIAFKDMGTPNSVGTLLDNVSVNCTGGNEPQVCTQGAPLYARIKLDTTDATKWRNWNGGNLNSATPFFVGGSNPAQHGSGGNVYMGNEWFPLTNANGSFINDADIAGYSNVPGVAIQRMNGAIRVVNYGYLTGTGKELAAGSIELSTNASARLLGAWDKPNGFIDPISNDPYTGTRLHDATVNDPLNSMDARGSFNGYINQYDPRFDNVRVNSDLFQFHLVTTTGTDGFYARYNYDDMIEVPCVQVD